MPGLHLNIVNIGTQRHVLQHKCVTQFRHNIVAADNGLAYLQALWCQDITIFTVGISQQCDESRAVRIIFDRSHTRWNIILFALVIHNTEKSAVTASTIAYGNVDPNFDIAQLAIGSGASFVARGTAYHVPALDKILTEAIEHKGLSVVEVINARPTTHGRRNKFKSPTDQLLWMKDSFMAKTAFEKLPPEQTAGKLPIGVLYKKENAPEYCETYAAMADGVRKKNEGRG